MRHAAQRGSSTRSRTRRAILDSAVSVLARHRTATLDEIAEAAEVGRSTLHRHFSNREELIGALVEDSTRYLDRAITEAALDDGPPREALHRLVGAMVEAGDRLVFVFQDPLLRERHTGNLDALVERVTALIDRAQTEGEFDPELDAGWIRHLMWALLYAGSAACGSGVLTRHAVTATVIRTLENGVRADLR